MIKLKVRPAERVEIETEYIKLDSFLKFAVLVETGGEAKQLINEGAVKVNGETCLMRGKKLYPGDTVTFFGKKYEVAEGKL